MKKIMPAFRDDNDKLITLAMVITAVFLVFIPPLVVILLPRKYTSDSTYEIAKTLFNFELLMFLVSLLFLVPIIGWIAGAILTPIFLIINVVIAIINVIAISQNTELKIPELFKFI